MKYAVLIAALMFSLQVNASEEPCRQQYMFSPSPRDLLDIVPIPDSDFSTAKEKNYSPGKSKFFTIRSGPTNTMLIYSVKGEGIRISVKEYEHRPLDGKWIN